MANNIENEIKINDDGEVGGTVFETIIGLSQGHSVLLLPVRNPNACPLQLSNLQVQLLSSVPSIHSSMAFQHLRT